MKHISYARDKFILTDEVNLNVIDNFLSVVRGYQVFTFLKTVNGGKPIFLDHHLDRVLSNAKTMNMVVKQSREEVNDIINETLNHNNFDESECNLMILFAGTKATDTSGLITDMPVDLFIVITPVKKFSKSYQKGISLGFFEYERSDSELKTPFNYFGGLKAQHAVVRNGSYDEALYTYNNMVLEGTTFSFFCVMDDDTIITTPTNGKILKSVTRLVVLKLLRKAKLSFAELPLSIEKVLACKEAFIVSANRDIIPVISIEGHIIGDGLIGEYTKSIMSLYQDCINSI
jgi:branched-subunit amino acid aminotransferase/4-amino-4-deoxychorismate lyase|tara:strand:+ start:995 stop:1858 length:864 start_codon:yes stop_codon:yes gene_type:complete